jgi:hypothetical protein
MEKKLNEVVVIDGVRTAFGKAGLTMGDLDIV